MPTPPDLATLLTDLRAVGARIGEDDEPAYRRTGLGILLLVDGQHLTISEAQRYLERLRTAVWRERFRRPESASATGR